ncbi:MAG: hypothetical protein CL944_00345 [Candidatus Diapherotrites archaeon]|uniref:Uncharacterized protein n=1 Tax=Candidatus Iainarchaeum sp. TaxID=3101447 RepID=A0A2D6LP11_9ARCH|nr:hypothetical protein [Candidatus Diapherotrites archaeon]
MNKILPIIILALLVLVSGCTTEQNSDVETPETTTQETQQEPEEQNRDVAESTVKDAAQVLEGLI